MENLEKKIIGDWIDVREESKDLYSLYDLFKIPITLLGLEVKKLDSSSELGIIEYKKSVLNTIFRTLANVKYKSLNLEIIAKLEKAAELLLFVDLIQKLIASGALKLDDEKVETRVSANDIEINHILKDILGRVKKNPALSKRLEVKNILVQFTIYKNERETLSKLAQTMKHKSPAFIQNVKTTFERIYASIRKNYEVLLKEDTGTIVKENVLKTVRGKKLSGILFNQAKEFTRILSTLKFVLTEKYKTREILMELYKTKTKIFEFLESEHKLYEAACVDSLKKDRCVASICNAFNKEISRIILKKI